MKRQEEMKSYVNRKWEQGEISRGYKYYRSAREIKESMW